MYGADSYCGEARRVGGAAAARDALVLTLQGHEYEGLARCAQWARVVAGCQRAVLWAVGAVSHGLMVLRVIRWLQDCSPRRGIIFAGRVTPVVLWDR